MNESYLAGDNIDYLESLQKTTQGNAKEIASHIRLGMQQVSHSKIIKKDINPDMFIESYRRYGHLIAQSNEFKQPDMRWDFEFATRLTPSQFGLEMNDTVCGIDGQSTTVSQLEQVLKSYYCGSIGFEYMHLSLPNEQDWWISQIEKKEQTDKNKLLDMFSATYRAQAFEEYISIQFPSQKRFSLEGLEPFIGLLNNICADFSSSGDNVVIGMAHRGRLNTLVNVLGIDIETISDMYTGQHGYSKTSGDVKYHLGYSCTRPFGNDELHITLAYNPSHLEAVIPVAMGMVRARQDALEPHDKSSIMPILIHGDAALSGQGVAAESLNMAYTKAYDSCGAIHIVLNNNIGFTTECIDGRSSRYCSDVAKMIEMPIMHVNTYDPIAVLRASELAILYRKKFKKDVMIVLNGYRKYGHNEADEPAITQPQLYAKIRSEQSISDIYQANLKQHLDHEKLQAVKKSVAADIAKKRSLVPVKEVMSSPREMVWKGVSYEPDNSYHCPQESMELVAQGMLNFHLDNSAISEFSQDYYQSLHPQVQKLIQKRWAMSKRERPLDWGMAELLAYNTALSLGSNVRIVGEDVLRGTFSHRHLAVFDNSGKSHLMCDYKNAKANIFAYNSTLSEYAAMAFEYGYATSSPNTLCIWEAQFGDFVNGAQIVIDQFLSCGWQKWQRKSGLVLLLPHGYEGQGPEHSSARVERFLQLCSQNNMYVCQPSTPAQLYHFLLRQVVGNYRIPLVIFTPKSLLRHPDCVSELSSLEKGELYDLIVDKVNCHRKKPKVMIVCTGRIYYDLKKKLADLDCPLLITRIEQLHPFPHERFNEILTSYRTVKKVVWVQDEPENMGAMSYFREQFARLSVSKQLLSFIARPAAASPASGYNTRHQRELEMIMNEVVNKVQEGM